MPGETSYVVLDEHGEPIEGRARAARPRRAAGRAAHRLVGGRVGVRGARRRPAARRAAARDRPGLAPVVTAPDADPDRAPDAADVGGDRAAAGPTPRGIAAVGHRCPCGIARRGDDRATAAQRHPVPDDLLPHLPAGGRPDRHPRGVRPDEGDGVPARRRPELAAAYRAAHDAYLADRALAARPGRACPRSRASPPAGCPTGSSASTCWPRTSLAAGPGVNPLGDEVLAASGTGGPRALRRPPGWVTPWSERRRRDRLRHQHHQAAHRPTAARRSCARPGWSGSGRASTPPARSPRRRWRGRSPRSTSTPS